MARPTKLTPKVHEAIIASREGWYDLSVGLRESGH